MSMRSLPTWGLGVMAVQTAIICFLMSPSASPLQPAAAASSVASNAQPFAPRAPANPCPKPEAAPARVPGQRKIAAAGPPDFKKLNKTALVKNLRTLTFARISGSKYGVGVTAIRNIPKGTDPFMLSTSLPCSEQENTFVCLSKAEILTLPKGVIKMVRDFVASEDGSACIPVMGLNSFSVAWYMNHSPEPNMAPRPCSCIFTCFSAIRDIREGEEMLFNYGNIEGNNWAFNITDAEATAR